MEIVLAFPAIARQACLTFQVDKATDKVGPKIVTWRPDFHQNLELGNIEKRTAAIVKKHLKSWGMEVKTGVASILKSKKPVPVIALRIDMDAFPVTERVPLPLASKVKALRIGNIKI